MSRKEAVGSESLMGILDRSRRTEVHGESIRRCDVMGSDAMACKQGQKDCVTIVTRRVGNTTRIRAVRKARKQEPVQTFFSRIPTRVRKMVSAVCAEMYDGFIHAAQEVFGDKVQSMIARFHVAQWYRQGVDTLRKAERKRLKHT